MTSQEKLITIKAEGGSRVGAYILDTFVFLPIGIVLMFLISFIFKGLEGLLGKELSMNIGVFLIALDLYFGSPIYKMICQIFFKG